ncbi:hypothetical protein [Bacteroides sp.]|uniref:hypothetical protein n=1 Tax=Bacteroides sp. TaxID=29523 RepID=UPI00262BB488|nr:hypothetical protein [Bacteroides sp.]MDD3039068.1 hypothetical protein [Bacteroides sp.]
MTEYLVTWTIDIEADSPIMAARLAKEIQQDPDSVANFFFISDPTTKTTTEIDLDEGCPYCGSSDITPNINTERYLECCDCGAEWCEDTSENEGLAAEERAINDWDEQNIVW